MSEHIEGRSHQFASSAHGFSWHVYGQKSGAETKLPAGPAVLIMLVVSASLWALIILAGLRALRFM